MDYKEKVLRCFSDLSERDRSNWGGHTAFLQFYDQTSGEERTSLIHVLGEIITEDDDWRIIADLLLIISALDLTQLDPAVEQLRNSGRFSENSVIAEQLATHTALQQLHRR